MKLLPSRGLLSCLVLLAVAGCHKKPQPPPPPQVSVVTVHSQTVPLRKQLVGRLSAYYTANVTARVSGVLLKRTFAEGGQVRQGQLLFQIDPTFYKSQLDIDLGVLAEDQATYANDRVIAQRNHQLLPIGSVSQQTVDNADAAALSAAARVKADEATVESARVNLAYTQVTSPISGIADSSRSPKGPLSAAAPMMWAPVARCSPWFKQIDQVYVNFTLSAADLMTLRQAQSAGSVSLAQQQATTIQIGLPNGSQYDRLGTLDFSGIAVNAATGAVNLRALVANPDHLLLPGMYVTLTANLGQQKNVFLIPQQATQRDTVGAYELLVGQDRQGRAQRHHRGE